MPHDGDLPGVERKIAALQAGLESTLIGRGELVERMLIALLAGGHLLIEGAPGLENPCGQTIGSRC